MTGLSVMSHGLMPQNGYDLVSYHYRQANAQLVEHLKEQVASKYVASLFIHETEIHNFLVLLIITTSFYCYLVLLIITTSSY